MRVFSQLLVAQAVVVILLGSLLERRRRRRHRTSDQPDPGPGEMGGNFG